MIEKDETVTIGWCDNDTVHGQFMQGVIETMLDGNTNGKKIDSIIRIRGNLIGRQRQMLFNRWANDAKTDWLLWVDSDICLNSQAIDYLWETADKVYRPVVSGVYFIYKDLDGTTPIPLPSIFYEMEENEFLMRYVHPLPPEQIMQVDHAGFGLVLMHKSIIPKLREKFSDGFLFAENIVSSKEEHYIGEDIAFFRKLKQANIPLYVHTGALVNHIKYFNFDANYYSLYWAAAAARERYEQQQALLKAAEEKKKQEESKPEEIEGDK